MKFYGIADCMGLESFVPMKPRGEFLEMSPDNETVNMMSMRAAANPQRHAVVFAVDIDVRDARIISDLLEKGKDEEALNELKGKAIEVSLARTPGAKKMWDSIPNKSLNPF